MSKKSTQQTKIWRSSALPGVEMMRARYTHQSFSRHFHEGYCLGVIEDGALAFRYRGENLVAPAGSVNLAVPGEVHDGHGADENGWTYRMFYLDPDVLATAAAQLSPSLTSLPQFSPGVIEDPAFASGLCRFHLALEQVDCNALEAQTRFLSLMACWIRSHADERPMDVNPGKEHRAVARVREVMEDRFADDLSLNELAREAHLSPYHLARTFTDQVGMPPHAYLTQVRVNRAAQMLHGRESIAQVASRVGFSDQSHLSRHFMRLRGVPPGAYRRSIRKIVQDC